MLGFVREQLGVNRTRGGEGCSQDALSELFPPLFHWRVVSSVYNSELLILIVQDFPVLSPVYL